MQDQGEVMPLQHFHFTKERQAYLLYSFLFVPLPLNNDKRTNSRTIMAINIGDTVRFLREKGGGKVTGFRKGGLILVEDKDGFEVPMLESDLVVIPDSRSQQTFSPASRDTHQSSGGNAPIPHTSQYSSLTRQFTSPGNQTEAQESMEERIEQLERLVQKLSRRIDELEAANALRAHARTPIFPNADKPNTKKPGKDEIIEIDLHAHALLDSTQGLSATEIKDYQMKIFRQTMEEYRRDLGRRLVFIHGNGDGVLRKAILTELKYSYKTCRHQDASFQQYGFGATMVTIG